MEVDRIDQYHFQKFHPQSVECVDAAHVTCKNSFVSQLLLNHHRSHIPAESHGHFSDCRIRSNLFSRRALLRIFCRFGNLARVWWKSRRWTEPVRERKLYNKQTVILCALGFVTSSITLDNAERTVTSSVKFDDGLSYVSLIREAPVTKISVR